MDYAEKILKKYGWKEGKGLGKEETGISKPIKCDLKFNKMGIGYQAKLSEETTSRWWENVYDKAASNLSSTGASDEESKSIDPTSFSKLTDEELFKACGGRTAHKAARHGLRLGGKLKRIIHQEQNFTDSQSDEPKKHKNKKHEKSIDESSVVKNNKNEVVNNLDIEYQNERIPLNNDTIENKKKKKHKKKPLIEEISPVETSEKVDNLDEEIIVTEKKKKSKKRKNSTPSDEQSSRSDIKSKKKRT